MHITSVDNIRDLQRERDTFFLHLQELRLADIMKPKSLPSVFDRNSAAMQTFNIRGAKYQRHVDSVDNQESLHHSGYSNRQPVEDSSRQNEKCHGDVHFAFLPERYEPLIDEEARARAKAEEKKKKKEQYKKVKKNVSKALRATWKCLMLGLHNFALGYSTPVTVAATFIPDFHPGRSTA